MKDKITTIYKKYCHGEKIKDLSIKYNLPVSTIYNHFEKHNLPKLGRMKHIDEFFILPSPKVSYWLGYLIGNGNIVISKNSTYSLHTSFYTLDHFNKFCKDIGVKIEPKVKNNKYYFIYRSSSLVKNLLSLNFPTNKNINSLPNFGKYENEFILGYFDSRVNLYYNEGETFCSIDIKSVNRSIILLVSKLLSELNITDKSFTNRILINNRKILSFYDYMYSLSFNHYDVFKYKKYIDIKDKIFSLIAEKYNGVAPVGCKGFNINYKNISKEYLAGADLHKLSKKYNVSQWTLLDNFNKLNVRKTQKRTSHFDVFEQDTPFSWYWAGFLAADGCIGDYSINMELGKRDEGHLDKFCRYIYSDATYGYRRNSVAVCIYSKEFSQLLQVKYNLVPNKTLILQPPNNLPKQYEKDFIRGYLDGDGSIGIHKWSGRLRFTFVCGSKDFIYWLYDRIIGHGFNFNLKIHKRQNSNCYSFGTQGKEVERFLYWLYDCNSEIRLDRKYNILEKYCLGA